MTNPLLSAALEYADHGWTVLPCRESSTGGKAKSPYVRFENASHEPEQITTFWEAHPGALIGLLLPPGVVVIDLDDRNGANLADLEELNGNPLPATLTSQSGRGEGAHYWFTTTSTNLSQKNGFLPGIDSRIGGKGYMIVAPSPHPETGRPYCWLNAVPMSPLPVPIEQELTPNPSRPQARASGLRSPGLHPTAVRLFSIQVLVRRVSCAVEGRRNDTLFWAACRMAEREKAGLAADWELLTQAAERSGHPWREIEATFKSARRTVLGK